MTRDPYLVLDLHPGASLQEIEEAYRRLSALYDDSVQPTDALRAYAREKREEVEEAYRALQSGTSGDFARARTEAQESGTDGGTGNGNPFQNPFQGYQQQQQQYQNQGYPNNGSCFSSGPSCGQTLCMLCALDACCDGGCCC